jgi:hypothetical protein
MRAITCPDSVRLDLLLEDAFSPLPLTLEDIMSISNFEFRLDVVGKLCECLILARLAPCSAKAGKHHLDGGASHGHPQWSECGYKIRRLCEQGVVDT